MAKSAVKTRILIISDTHTAPLGDATSDLAFRYPLPKADVVLHCGDLTQEGRLDEYEHTLNMLKQIDAELKLVIAGNHDVSLDEHYQGPWGVRGNIVSPAGEDIAPPGSPEERRKWFEYVGKAKAMWTSEEARKIGVVYLEEQVRKFELSNGAEFTVYASPYQPTFCRWAFDYQRKEDRWNPPSFVEAPAKPIAKTPIPDFPAVDIVMTHGPPYGYADTTYDKTHVGCPHLLKALSRARPKLFCCGHIHEAWGAHRLRWQTESSSTKDGVASSSKLSLQRDFIHPIDISATATEDHGGSLEHGKETLVVNAAIMNLMYRPTQAPFLVDVDLPRKSDTTQQATL